MEQFIFRSRLFLVVLLALVTQFSFAQINFADSMSNVETCLAPSLNKFTFTVTTGGPNSYAEVEMPSGFEFSGFVNGSNTNGGTVTYAGEIAGYHRFSISNTTAGATVVIRFRQFATCGAGTSSFTTSNNVRFYNGTALTTYTTSSFNGIAPSLSITNISNTPSPATVADTVVRTFTVTNGGVGPTGDFIIVDKHNLSGLTIDQSSLRINPAGANYTVPAGSISTSGDSLILSIDRAFLVNAGIGDSDSLFENSESFILQYKMEVNDCSIPTIASELMAAWQCPSNDRCHFTTVNTGIATFGPALPRLILAERRIRQTDCHDNSLQRDTIVLRNNSTGAATDIVMDAGANYYSSSFRADYRGTYMDTASFKVKIGENGTWFKPAYTVQQTVNNGASFGCNYLGRPGYIRFTIPYIAGGDSLFVLIGQYQCDIQIACNSSSSFENTVPMGGTAVNFTYKNACGNASFDGGWVHGITQRRPSAEGTKTGASAIGDGEFKDLSFDITNLPKSSSSSLLYGSRGKDYIKVTLPNVIQLDTPNYANPIYFESPTGVQYYPERVSGDTAIFRLQNNYHNIGSQLHIKVKGVCDGVTCSGILFYQVEYFYNPDTTGCSNINRMFCQNYPIAWTSSCVTCCTKGMVNLRFDVNRTNVGLPDHDNDGIPSGSFSPGDVRTKRTVAGDTIEFVHKFYILTDATDTQFEHVRSLMEVSSRTHYSVISDSVFIDRTTGTDTSASVTPSAFNASTYNTNISSFGPFFNGDTVVIRLKLRVENNPVGNFRAYTITNGGGASRVSNYTPQYSCGVFVDDQTIYGVDGFGYVNGTFSSDGCEQIVLPHRHYIRISGGADRYDHYKFPNEVRHFGHGTEIYQILPSGFTVDSVIFRGYTGGANSVNQPYSGTYALQGVNIPYTVSDDTLILYTGGLYENRGGNIILPDEGYIVTYNTYLSPTCQSENGVTNTYQLYDSFQFTSTIFPSSYQIGVRSPRNSPNIVNFHPSLVGNSALPISTAYTSSVDWPFQVSSLSTFDATNNWLYIDTLSSRIRIDSIKQSGTILMPDSNGFYRYGTVSGGGVEDFDIYATAESCDFDSVYVYLGYSCDGNYPTSFADTTCSYSPVPLYVQPQAAAIQTQITALATTPSNPFDGASADYGRSTVDMCSSFPMEMEIQRTQPGTIFDVNEFVLLPFNAGNAGVDLQADSITIEYPIGTTPRLADVAGRNLMANTAPLGTMQLDLELLDSTNFDDTKGLLGTGLGTSTTRRVVIRWVMRPNCDLISGAQWNARQEATAPCGDPAQGNRTITSGFPIDIDGAVKPYVVTTEVTPAFGGCSPATGDTTVIRMIKIGATLPSSLDSAYITIPQSSVFGDIECYGTNCPGGAGGTISPATVNVSVAGGEKTYTFPIPSTFDVNGDTLRFEMVSYDTGTTCPTASQIVVGVREPITILCNGTACPNSAVNLGVTTASFDTRKADLSVISLVSTYKTDTNANALDSLTINFSMSNAQAGKGTDFTLNFYEDINSSGAVDAGDQLIANVMDTISTTYTLDSLFTAASGTFSCPIVAEVTSDCGCTPILLEQGVCNVTAVPVELIAFNVTKLGEKALVKWSTATEINSDYFEVERSVAGGPFQRVATIKAAGNSTSTLQYNYLDNISGITGAICYRLKPVDYDRSFTISEVRCIRVQRTGEITFYPNPTEGKLTINAESLEQEYLIEIMDINGRLLETTAHVNNADVSLAKYENGVYLVVLKVGEIAVHRERIVLQR